MLQDHGMDWKEQWHERNGGQSARVSYDSAKCCRRWSTAIVPLPAEHHEVVTGRQSLPCSPACRSCQYENCQNQLYQCLEEQNKYL